MKGISWQFLSKSAKVLEAAPLRVGDKYESVKSIVLGKAGKVH